MTPTTIRLDDETRKKAQKLAQGIGFSFNDLVVILLKKAIREGGMDLRHNSLTENGFTPKFEKRIINTHQANDYEEFESVEEMINKAKHEA